MTRSLLAATMMAAAALTFNATAWAFDDSKADDEKADDSGDAASRGVARISVISGNVSVRRGDSAELVAAALNAPVVATDRVVTGDASKAEVQFDGAHMVRLAPSTEVRIGELQYHKYQVQIAIGSATFRVLRDSDADVEISTPSVSIKPLKRGVYRITVRADGTSEMTVRSGEADIFSPNGSEKLGAGKTMRARGSASDPEFQVVEGVPLDAFDQWNATRDRDLDRLGTRAGVNPDINGVEELDGHGRWVEDPAYGTVWVPTVDPGWAPYRVGRWVWVDYYGWTWVSGDPWGWAPYHYGRWYWGSFGGWAWYPGPIMGPCYWRPALVGFFGWGGGVGVGVGFGFGHVGWVPLAPYERFHAWYGPGFYGRSVNINIVRNTNITNVYRNARVTNGVTSLTATNFGRGGVNAGNYVHATPTDLARAGAVRGAMPVAPSRESTQFSNRSANTAGMPKTGNSSFYSTRAASQTPHVPFAQQHMTEASQRASGQTAGPRTAGGTAPNSGGWQRVSPSSGANATGTNTTGRAAGQGTAASSANGGWQKLGGNAGTANSGTTRTTQPQQQPVRINPSIVQNRSGSTGTGSGSSSGSTTTRAPESHGGFGGAHSSSGNGSGNGGGSRSGGSGGGGGGSRGSGGGGRR